MVRFWRAQIECSRCVCRLMLVAEARGGPAGRLAWALCCVAATIIALVIAMALVNEALMLAGWEESPVRLLGFLVPIILFAPILYVLFYGAFFVAGEAIVSPSFQADAVTRRVRQFAEGPPPPG